MKELPKIDGPLSGQHEVTIWHTAYAAAYVERLLNDGPSIDRHAAARDSARLIADATVVGYRELVRRKAGKAWDRALTASVGKDPDTPPHHTP